MSIATAQYQKKVWQLIAITVIVKIILSYFIELGNDEVYYYTYAVQPDWNHFDHPPMVGWLIRCTTLNLHWVSTLSMRLGAIMSSALAMLVIFKTGVMLKNERAGYLSALLYALSIYTSIIAGFFILPDSPQLLFYTLSIYFMVKYVTQPHSFNLLYWILLGLCIGLATLSKVHGLFLWAGFGAYLLFHQRKSLKQPALYTAILVTLFCLVPIVYWNIQNDFITYRYHSSRVVAAGIHWDDFFQQIIGEILYQNPLVYLAILIPLIQFKKLKGNYEKKGVLLLLLWLSLPLIFTFWALSLFNSTLPHWTGPGFIGLILIAGIYWSTYSIKSIPTLFQLAVGFVVALIFGFLLLVYVFPKQLGSAKSENLGEYNPINDVTGWTQCKAEFKQLLDQDVQLGKMSIHSPILTHKWFPGGHILFYISDPLKRPLIGVGNLTDLHKFAWLNKNLPPLQIGENAYTIIPSNLPADPAILYGAYFEKIELAKVIPIQSKGVLLRNFYVYRLIGCKKIPSSILK